MDNENTNNANYQKFITLKTLKDFLDKCDKRYQPKPYFPDGEVTVIEPQPPTDGRGSIGIIYDRNLGDGRLGDIENLPIIGKWVTPPNGDGDSGGDSGSGSGGITVPSGGLISLPDDFITFDIDNGTNFKDSVASVLKFNDINTSKITSFANVFNNCQNLKQLDIACFDTSKATTMANMFSACPQLKSIDVLGFNTANVTSMASMFAGDTSLESIDLTNFDLRNVTDLSNMFNGCTNLKEITFGNGFKYGFNASRDRAIYSNGNLDAAMNCRGMFKGCSSLTSIDLSYMDPAVICVDADIDSVEDTKELIYNKFISGLTIPDIDVLGSADAFFARYFINLGMFDMFEGCTRLTEIKTNTNIDQTPEFNQNPPGAFAFGHTPWVVGTGVSGDPNAKPVFTICNLADCHLQRSLADLFKINRFDYDRTHQSLFGVILNNEDFDTLISLVQGRTYYQSNGARIYFDGYIVIKNDYFISPTSEIIVDDDQ